MTEQNTIETQEQENEIITDDVTGTQEADVAIKEVAKEKKTRGKTKQVDENVTTVNAIGDLQQTVREVTAKPVLGIFKLNEHTQTPSYGTQASACFDIRLNLQGEVDKGTKLLTVYTKDNKSIERRIDFENGVAYVELRPYERLITPTGMILDIPDNYSVKVHPRSGTSLKQGINLINQEAVIDSDYVDELKLLLVNDSNAHVKIFHGERYAQGELQQVIQNEFVELAEAPAQKTDRTGGLGHTGKN